MNRELFNDEDKVAAFDRIAERYYFQNFGSMRKSDIELLLFDIYLEQVHRAHPDESEAYSDYTLSKALGITQSRIASLKERRSLVYPNTELDWREELAKIAERATYKDEKIRLFIPERIVYIEVKNAVESAGGYIEVQLTRNLLQVELSFFLDLLLAISDEGDREQVRAKLWQTIRESSGAEDLPQKQPISMRAVLREEAPEMILDLIGACIPVFGGPTKVIGEHLLNAIRKGWDGRRAGR